MRHRGIKAKDLKPKKFIDEKVREIREIAGGGIAISALSGGVDSSVVTALAHRALGRKLKTYLIDNGIMREGEPRKVKALFEELGIPVTIVDARQAFFDAMKGITDPEMKREAITQTFYKKVFRGLVLKSKATILLQGTILTDIEETAAGIKRQHNVLSRSASTPGRPSATGSASPSSSCARTVFARWASPWGSRSRSSTGSPSPARPWRRA